MGGCPRDPPADDEPPDHIVYDPRDPVMSLMRADAQAAPVDQSPHDHRRDILVYQTPPLDEDMEVTGPVVAEAVGGEQTVPTRTGPPNSPWCSQTVCASISPTASCARDIETATNTPSLLEPGKPYEY